MNKIPINSLEITSNGSFKAIDSNRLEDLYKAHSQSDFLSASSNMRNCTNGQTCNGTHNGNDCGNFNSCNGSKNYNVCKNERNAGVNP